VEAGEADALVPERVWQEVARGLMERDPSRMLAVLRECGALARVLPELDAAFERPEVPEKLAARLDHAAAERYGLAVRYAVMLLDLDARAASALGARVNAPTDCRELALLAGRERDLMREDALDAQGTLDLLERCDAFRRPERLERLLEALACDRPAGAAFRLREWTMRSLAAARALDAGAVAREHPEDIPGAIRRARLVAIAALESAPG
jgi:tRNA nucleotidyltransferase (CCA-adding enzyme)